MASHQSGGEVATWQQTGAEDGDEVTSRATQGPSAGSVVDEADVSGPRGSGTSVGPDAEQASRPTDEEIVRQQNDIMAEQAKDSALVGSIEQLSALEEEYKGNDVFVEKLKYLQKEYHGARRVRRDGNCFFRGFIFGYLESLLVHRNFQEKNRYIELLPPNTDTHYVPVNGDDAEENGRQPVLNLLVKGDTKGTVEAARDAVLGLASEAVGVSVLQVGVGPVTEADILYAEATQSTVLAFNVKSHSSEIVEFARQRAVDIHQNTVIYRLLDKVGDLLTDLAPMREEEEVQGEAEVLQVFRLKGKKSKDAGVVAGCRCLDGFLQRSDGCLRVKRGDDVLFSGKCLSLRRLKLDVERVGKGSEFGAILDGFTEMQQGDTLEYVVTKKVKPKTEAVMGGGVRVLLD